MYVRKYVKSYVERITGKKQLLPLCKVNEDLPTLQKEY